MKEKLPPLFFGLEIVTHWPEIPHEGRIINEEMRHITLAFLGNAEQEQALMEAKKLQAPQFGPVGIFNECHFFPKGHPRCVAWQALWQTAFETFQEAFIKQLVLSKLLPPPKRPFVPHVTVARAPFDKKAFKQSFSPIAFYAKALHLYQSKGYSTYTSLWHMPWRAPFVEIEHTADLAFHVYGRDIKEISVHAQAAMCYAFSELIPYAFTPFEPETIDDIVMHLNNIIALCDSEQGASVKAVSYHDTVKKTDSEYIWEMIIDV